MRQGLVGHLRIGGIPVVLPILALLTTPFAELYPRVRISVASLTSREIERGLHECSLDVGLTYLDNEPLARVRSVPLYRERYVLLTPANGRFTGRTTATWAEASTLQLCLLNHAMQNRRIIDANFHEAGVTPDPMLETNSVLTLASHLRHGEWSSVLPHTITYVLGEVPGLQVIPLVEPEATHEIGLIFPDREPVAPVASAIIAVARNVDIDGALRAMALGHTAPLSMTL